MERIIGRFSAREGIIRGEGGKTVGKHCYCCGRVGGGGYKSDSCEVLSL